MTGRRTDAPPLSEPWICVKCTAVRGAHYLTCPVLRLPPREVTFTWPGGSKTTVRTDIWAGEGSS